MTVLVALQFVLHYISRGRLWERAQTDQAAKFWRRTRLRICSTTTAACASHLFVLFCVVALKLVVFKKNIFRVLFSFVTSSFYGMVHESQKAAGSH
jgi:hypothetical protein